MCSLITHDHRNTIETITKTSEINLDFFERLSLDVIIMIIKMIIVALMIAIILKQIPLC